MKTEDGADIWRTQAQAAYTDGTSEQQPSESDRKWAELVNSLRAFGVQVPILVVTKSAFLKARPTYKSAIDASAQYVVVYGHRRAAAAKIAGLKTVRAVIDDAVLDNGGDLDAMTVENLGREDLTPIQEAEVFARHSEAGLGQRAIAEKLGYEQSTVSRRLRLLLLLPEVIEGMEVRKIKASEAVQLGTQLPYGPQRPWQPEDEYSSEQDSDDRRSDQLAAYNLILSGATPKAAADAVRAERRGRALAAAKGLEIVDPEERFGPLHQRYAVTTPEEAGGNVVAAIDPTQGGLVYYPADVEAANTPEPKSPAPTNSPDRAKERSAAMKARRAACVRLVAAPPPRDKLLPLLASQYASGIAALATSSAGWNLAFTLSQSAGLTSADQIDSAAYRSAAANATDLKRQLEITWACAIAGYELHASDKGRDAWNHLDDDYLQLLRERADYTLSPWERQRLDTASDRGTAPGSSA
ncbi:ParB/RepB/Spo0J family partition protein [Mycobacteroides abscessus]|uniref:ParB/RepB/Spo0J family partition protein n=1 Tax=Mycobacteroides abscessus TaxID=36809 RepID=UPI0030803165